MFPVVLDVACVSIALIGNGKEATNRLKKLDEADASHVVVYADNPEEALIGLAGGRLIRHLPAEEEIEAVLVVMIAGLDTEISSKLATIARGMGRLVNVEDDTKWCDFHFPSMVRRGDLLLTVSTKGKSPTLARRIRQWLGGVFGSEWEVQLNEMGLQREAWRKQGLTFHEVMKKSEAYIDDKGWLSCLSLNTKK